MNIYTGCSRGLRDNVTFKHLSNFNYGFNCNSDGKNIAVAGLKAQSHTVKVIINCDHCYSPQ